MKPEKEKCETRAKKKQCKITPAKINDAKLHLPNKQ